MPQFLIEVRVDAVPHGGLDVATDRGQLAARPGRRGLEFVTIEFDGHGGEALVFPRGEMVASTEEILTDNGVRSQGSPDTLAVWNAKGSTRR